MSRHLWGDKPWQKAAFLVVVSLCVAIMAVFAAVTIRLGYQVLTGPAPAGDALTAMWAFIGATVAAGVTLTGLFFTRIQADRTERRLNLETAVGGLELLAGENQGYAPRATMAGAIATLVHLDHPVIAMRALAAAWNDDAVDVPSATWLLSEIFTRRSEPAKIEAAAMLDAHAHELCGDEPGRFSWPFAIEFSWPRAPFPARLLVFHAVLTTLMSRPRTWWRQGGREGWAALLLYEAMQTDANENIKAHARHDLLLLLETTSLSVVMGLEDWVAVETIKAATKGAPGEEARRILVLRSRDERLKAWAQSGDSDLS
jgi:hypothetical protein